MLMLCWFYCIPFAILFYFAFGPLLFVFSMFAVKRGLRQARKGLRKASFIFMFLSAVKVFIFDIRMGEKYLFCDKKIRLPMIDCSPFGFRVAEFASLLLLALVSMVLFHYYGVYVPERKRKVLQPEDVNLRFWANLGVLSVVAMIIWTMAPWVGSLLVGSVPKMFTVVQWQHFAIGNFLLLLIGFWKAESCSWEYNSTDKANRKYMTGGWTPRDTLWLNSFLYLITLGLSYVAHDVLTGIYQDVQPSALR